MKTVWSLFASAIICSTIASFMYAAMIEAIASQEKSTLANPTVINKTVLEYEIAGISITRIPEWKLVVTYVDNLGTVYTDEHKGQVDVTNTNGADQMIIALNKANLSVKSLERRVMEHLIAEGKIPTATITGTPR